MTRLLALLLSLAYAQDVAIEACLVRDDAPLPACAGGPPAPPPPPAASVASLGVCTCTCVDGAARLTVEDPWTLP